MSRTNHSSHIAHVHGPESPVGHHFQSILVRLQEDSIELDELAEQLAKYPDSIENIYAEIELLTTESHFNYEIRSLKHAVLLLGINRIQELLKREIDGAGISILRTA